MKYGEKSIYYYIDKQPKSISVNDNKLLLYTKKENRAKCIAYNK